MDHELALLNLAPAVVVLVAFVRDTLSLIKGPRFLRSSFRWLCSPFKNFLTENDLDGLKPAAVFPSTLESRSLLALALFQVAIWLGALAYAWVAGDSAYGLDSLLALISWLYISLRITLRPPATVPYLAVLFAALHGLASLSKAFSYAYDGLQVGLVFQLVQAVVSTAFMWIAGTLPIQSIRVSPHIARSSDVPSVHLSCPEDDVTLWSWSTFTFLEPIFGVAQKRTLNDDDVWSLSPYFLHKNLFNKRLEYQARHPNHSLLRFLIMSNSLDLILDIVLKLWIAVMGFVPSYSLKEILAALAENAPGSRNRAFYWTVVTFLVHLSFAQADLFQNWHTRRCYERTRGQLFCAVHYKALKRQDVRGKVEDDEKDSANLGRILNLMQGDTYAVAQRFWEFSAIFTAPVRLIIAMVFLYNILGWSSLFGVLMVIIAYILNYPLAKYNISITRASWKAKDFR